MCKTFKIKLKLKYYIKTLNMFLKTQKCFKKCKEWPKTDKLKKMQNKLSYSHSNVYESNLWQNEHHAENFGKQCKVHRNPSLSYNTQEYIPISETE